jgi:hypothetical protein
LNVGQHPFDDGDAAVGEPRHGAAQYYGRGGGCFVVVDFGVGHAELIVVDKGGA